MIKVEGHYLMQPWRHRYGEGKWPGCSYWRSERKWWFEESSWYY